MAQTTVAAIATPLARGALSVIRISGPAALDVAAKVFTPVSGADIRVQKGYTAYFGQAHDASGAPLDQCVLTVFRAPRSYTGEEVAELSCHGGMLVTKQVLRAVYEAGAEPAGPGEFTKRAFLNGKLSLSQAEAVMDLIHAQSEGAVKSALAAQGGALEERIGELRRQLLDVSAHVYACVDFPEEDVPELTVQMMEQALLQVQSGLSALLATYDTGRMLRDGVDTVIVGRPNVGKSTLMNLLAGCTRSIVTHVAGTTRDIVEESVTLSDSVVLRLSDTAGIRETADEVEQIGVALSKERLSSAQLVLALFDASEPLTEDDQALIALVRGKHTIAVINKTDLASRLDTALIEAELGAPVFLSAQTGEGKDALAARIEEVLDLHAFDAAAPALFTERQRALVCAASEAVAQAQEALRAGMTFDALSVSLDCALAPLLELTGENVSERVIDEVFSQFCVGK